MTTKLNKEIIESYNLPKEFYKPDWDDAGYKYTLPSGIDLVGFYMLNNDSCEMEALEGLDGWIYIETEEELKEYMSLSYNETLSKIATENEDFDISEWEE